MTIIRPMLADNKRITDQQMQAHLDEAGFLIMEPKIDGMRALIDDSAIPRTRSFKEHKNKYLRRWALEHPSLRGLDGEVVSGHIMDANVFRETMSGIRAEDGSPEFTFYGFDNFSEAHRYNEYLDRLKWVEDLSAKIGPIQIGENYSAKFVVCPYTVVRSLEEIYAKEQEYLTNFWEGGILRRNDRAYKYNRSTNREGSLIKLKRFDDDEAVVVGSYAWEVNENEATESILGYTVRSAHKAGKVPIERLGGFHCELLRDRSIKFDIGVFRGWSHSDRDRLWAARDSLNGLILKFKHQGYGGGYDAPRTPVGLGWRDSCEL